MVLLACGLILVHFRAQNKLLRQSDAIARAEIAHQQDLLLATITSEEKERKRIGQDLHDDIGTSMSNLRLLIERLGTSESTEFDIKQNAKKLIDKIIQDVRLISHNISPPGIGLYGFFGVLEDFCDSVSSAGILKIKILNEAETHLKDLSSHQSIALYRVLTELINNTLKHANADLIEIIFKETAGKLYIHYNDNGSGFNLQYGQTRGMGLLNIESRLKSIGALFTLSANAGCGFHLDIFLTNP